MYILIQSKIVEGEYFLSGIDLKHLLHGTDCSMEWCRGWWPQVNKIEIKRKLQKHGQIRCVYIN